MKVDITFRRIYAIPDVHGEHDLLNAALDKMKASGFDPLQDALVFTGDIIDRGPNVRGCLDTIIDLMTKHPDNVFMVRGNHDDFAVSFYTKGKGDYIWEINGMASTLRSYPNERMSDEHIVFLGSLPYSLELGDFFFSHAPVPREKHRRGNAFFSENRGHAGEEYTVHELTWTYYGPESEKKGALFEQHEGPRSDSGAGDKHLIGICGHIHRGPSVREVRIFPNYRLLDVGCGCFRSGRLAIHECISNTTQYVEHEEA